MRYLLDTSVVSNLMWPRPTPQLRARAELHAASSAISSTVWFELRFGLARMPLSKRRTLLEAYLEEVSERFEILPYDNRAAAWHALEQARLMDSGLPAPFADAQIAAVAATNGLVLATANPRDFLNFQGLIMEDWTLP